MRAASSPACGVPGPPPERKPAGFSPPSPGCAACPARPWSFSRRVWGAPRRSFPRSPGTCCCRGPHSAGGPGRAAAHAAEKGAAEPLPPRGDRRAPGGGRCPLPHNVLSSLFQIACTSLLYELNRKVPQIPTTSVPMRNWSMKSKWCALHIQRDHLRVSLTHFDMFCRMFLPH